MVGTLYIGQVNNNNTFISASSHNKLQFKTYTLSVDFYSL